MLGISDSATSTLLIRRLLSFLYFLFFLGALATPLTAAADFNRAVENFAAERYQVALKEFSSLAVLGHAGSQFNVGAMYFLGQGVEKNTLEAYAWIALAAQAEHTTAITLRDRLWGRFNSVEREQAETRFAELQDSVGVAALQKTLWPTLKNEQPAINVETEGVRNKAPEYPRRALNLRIEGVVDIEYTLDADGYVTDFFVLESSQKIFTAPVLEAVQFWRFAPVRFDGEPASILGQSKRIHFRIESVNQSAGTADFLKEQALGELRTLADAGEPLALFNYAHALMLEQENTAAAEANKWYLQASQAGLPEAQYQLGRNLMYGIGCERDIDKAWRWLTLAAEASLPKAQYALAALLQTREPELAMSWLDRAVTAQLPVAMVSKAWRLATHPDDHLRAGDEALHLIKRQLKNYPDTLGAHRTLAASQAASGDFSAAAATQKEVVKLAKKFSRPVAIEEQRLAVYQEKNIWRESSSSRELIPEHKEDGAH
jgi:TonB family protein